MTKSIEILERELEKAAAALKTLKSEMALAGRRDECKDALYGLHKSAELIRDEAEELLIDLQQNRFPTP